MPDVKACRFHSERYWINATTFGDGQAYVAIVSQPGVNQWRLEIFYVGGATGSEGFCLYESKA